MRVHLYAICWNEQRMLPFFFRHYDELVERYVMFDDGSTDATLDMLAGHPRTEVRPFPRTNPGSFVLSAQTLQNMMWKESRGRCDWVIVTAVDEHLQHAQLRAYLAEQQRLGTTAIPALGYQMIADALPPQAERLCDECVSGAPYRQMSKLSIFDPSAIAETGFRTGRHLAAPTGSVRYPERDEVLNLHYKYVGMDYVRDRHMLLKTGLGPVDVANRWGHKYHYSDEELKEDWRQFAERAVDVRAAAATSHESHREQRWWRPAAVGPTQ